MYQLILEKVEAIVDFWLEGEEVKHPGEFRLIS